MSTENGTANIQKTDYLFNNLETYSQVPLSKWKARFYHKTFTLLCYFHTKKEGALDTQLSKFTNSVKKRRNAGIMSIFCNGVFSILVLLSWFEQLLHVYCPYMSQIAEKLIKYILKTKNISQIIL